MLYLYTLLMLAWDLDKDTHAYFREYLEAFINKRKISKDLVGFIQDTRSVAQTVHLRPWPSVADNFIALRLGLPYRVVRGTWGPPRDDGGGVKGCRSLKKRQKSSPKLIETLHPPKYHHDARKLSTPWNSYTNP